MPQTDRTLGSPNGSTYKRITGWTTKPVNKNSDWPYNLTIYEQNFFSHVNCAHTQGAGVTLANEQGPNALSNSMNEIFGSAGRAAANKAYNKFKGDVYDQASNLTNLRERAKTYEMLAEPLGKLYRGAKALRSGDLNGFLKEFGVSRLPKHRKRKSLSKKSLKKAMKKSNEKFSELWLAYWMGWAPTIGDLCTTMETLGKPVPPETIRAGGRASDSGQYKASGSYAGITSYEFTHNVWYTGQIKITNYNVFEQEKQGLFNIPKTLWETVPMSFLVDWFLNVGQVLGQMTDFAGLQFTRLCKSSLVKGTSDVFYTRYGYAGREVRKKKGIILFRRTPLTQMPFVQPNVVWLPKVTKERVLTSYSLFTTVFLSKRK